MNAAWIVLFSATAAVGNALFALGQKQSAESGNGLLLVAGSALIGCALCAISASFLGPVDAVTVLKGHWRPLLLSGTGLFLTYLGFTLLYTRFGASAYVVYASMSVLTTAVGVGFLYFKETPNQYHVAAVVLAVAAIVLFSIGQSRG